jgi:protein-S-isoprenylcysteine O-methyltransferase Ste14
LTLKENFNSTGQWLFARRSYVPLVLIPLTALVILCSHDYPQAFASHLSWKLFCLFVAVLGEAIRCVTVGTAAPFTSGRNTGDQLADSINTTGIYSTLRHPLYLGNFITVLGITMWTGVWWFIAMVIVLYWFYYERIIFREEQFMEEKFGEQYRAFAARVPAIIPSFRNYVPARLPFSAKIVLAREYDGVLAIASAFALVDAMEYFLSGAHRAFDPLWVIIFVVTFVVTAFLRYARKHTSLLVVPGR